MNDLLTYGNLRLWESVRRQMSRSEYALLSETGDTLLYSGDVSTPSPESASSELSVFYGFFPGRRAAVQKRRRPGGISVRLPPLLKDSFVRNPAPSLERNPRGTCRAYTFPGRRRGMKGACR